MEIHKLRHGTRVIHKGYGLMRYAGVTCDPVYPIYLRKYIFNFHRFRKAGTLTTFSITGTIDEAQALFEEYFT